MLRSRWLAAACAGAAAALAVLPAAARSSIGPLLTAPGGPAAATIPSTFFGMTYASFPTAIGAEIGSSGKGGCDAWADLETSSGTYQWGALDTEVSTAESHNSDFLYSFGQRLPEWSISSPSGASCSAAPTYCPGAVSYCYQAPVTADLTAFTTALVNRYGHNHIVYELFNEPYDISPTLGCPGGKTCTVTPSQMAAMEVAEYNAIRTADPLATIVSQSMTPSTSASFETYFSDLYAAGAPTGVDAVSMHLYAWGSLATDGDYPEAIDPITSGTYGAKFNMGNIQSLLNANGLSGKPLWDTEGSWNDSANHPNFPDAATEAGFLARWYLMHWAIGFKRAYWYEYDNATFGTLRPASRGDGSTLPQTAYAQVYSWMVGHQMTAPCTWNADHVTWTCGFTGSGGYQSLAAWDTAGNESFTPPNAGTYTQYRDLAGTVHPYSGGAVTIGISPILFEN